jgi:hypothetical protein
MSLKSSVIRERRYITYANVVATLALVLSMSGGALAASHYLINSTSQINPKVRRALTGKSGKVGAAGPQGVQGPQGAPGSEGAQGPKGEKGTEGTKGLQGEPASIPALPAVIPFEASTYVSGWSNYGTAQPPGYYKDALGIVHLTGTLKASSSADVPGYIIDKLPAGYVGEGFFPSGSSEGGGAGSACTLTLFGSVGIYADSGCDYKEISLEGITYRPIVVLW